MRAFLVAGLALLGCGPQTLKTGPTMPTTVEVGGTSRQVRSLTDLDGVRDVAAGPHHVMVATDDGVLVYPPGEQPGAQRLTEAEGLPSNDVTAVAADAEGHLRVATAGGMAALEPSATGARVVGERPAPPVGRVMDLVIVRQTQWACGLQGVARRSEQGWERFGEPAHCIRLVATPQGHLWVGTTEGAWYIEGDVVREHAPRHAIPGRYVRDFVSLGSGKAMALVQDGRRARLAYFDGDRWYAYTIEGFDRPLVGLATRGTDILLFTPDYTYAIGRAGDAQGVALTMLSRSDLHTVRSYRARITPAGAVSAAEPPDRDDLLQAPVPPAEVPADHEAPEGSHFVIRPFAGAAKDAYLARRNGPTVYLAERNRGVLELPVQGEGRRLRSHDLVVDKDLQVASDAERATWVVTDEGQLGRWRDGGLDRVPAPQGVNPQAISGGPRGAYMAALVEGTPAAVRVYRMGPQGFTPLVERQLELPTELRAVPFMAVDDDERFWLALRVRRENSDGERMRGVAVLRRDSERVVYHHRGADPEKDGKGALSMPDEISSIDLRDPGMAWFASLEGALRLGNHQAVKFGEARGVRGEIVTDVAVGRGRVWVAAAEGLGYYEKGDFEFNLPTVAEKAEPQALATDTRGTLWGAGDEGVVYFDGQRWHRLTRDEALPRGGFRDVEIDEHNRVWLLARDRMLVFTRATP